MLVDEGFSGESGRRGQMAFFLPGSFRVRRASHVYREEKKETMILFHALYVPSKFQWLD